MMRVRKKSYREQLQELVQEYRDAGMPWPAEAEQISQWAIFKRKWEQRPQTLIRQLAKALSRAMRDETFRDPQGRRVRRKHAVPFSKQTADGVYTQHIMWVDMLDAGRNEMHAAFQLRRQQTSGDVKQLVTDVDSYNDNYNKGVPILISVDFTDDVADARQPATFEEPMDADDVGENDF